ncbi:ATP-binding protein [Streptomyces sp. NPDC007901]|uniref:ATP-binding protein n=1 Tax=Streptomyces sp. NPDC007901 TaxID=3364785 RepID=UPI0036E6E869
MRVRGCWSRPRGGAAHRHSPAPLGKWRCPGPEGSPGQRFAVWPPKWSGPVPGPWTAAGPSPRFWACRASSAAAARRAGRGAGGGTGAGAADRGPVDAGAQSAGAGKRGVGGPRGGGEGAAAGRGAGGGAARSGAGARGSAAAGAAGGQPHRQRRTAQPPGGRLGAGVDGGGRGRAAELFRPFRRLGAEDRVRKRDGLGLGMSIAAAVVAAHGGRVRAHPHLAGGLTVEVALPPVTAVVTRC